MTKKILLSSVVVVAAAAVVVGATTAFFSDTETSTGNTFTAGAIDLQIDNDSYYSALDGLVSSGTSWIQKDLEDGDWFFNFSDLKPGDWGEDTISLHVNNNDAYACVDVRLDSNDDVSSTEPELEDGDVHVDDNPEGELANRVNFIWWVDDGDNVWEDDEQLLPAGPLGNLNVGQVATVALAEPNNGGIFGGALTGNQTYYIGKAWCFGGFNEDWLDDPPAQDDGEDADRSPITHPVVCDGSGEDNQTQTDSLSATISFYAEQARNNDGFECSAHLGNQLD
ncbi:MAG: hypothetical protein HYW77_00580 [Parcubacteria group bacterium]|nr:hypothetical protein [Parcubacteria group bacterium]